MSRQRGHGAHIFFSKKRSREMVNLLWYNSTNRSEATQFLSSFFQWKLLDKTAEHEGPLIETVIDFLLGFCCFLSPLSVSLVSRKSKKPTTENGERGS
jgi:hypothetical protein